MKKVLTLTLLAAIYITAAAQINLAHVNKVYDLYIFTDCEPVDEYEMIGEVTCSTYNDYGSTSLSTSIDLNGNVRVGTISTPGTGIRSDVESTQYTSVRDFLIQRARIAYKDIDGILLYPQMNGTNRAIAITFKSKSDTNKLAMAKQIQGLYIFTDCRPVLDYTTVGFNRSKFGLLPEYTYLRNRFIDKCSKKTLKASNAVIYDFVDGGEDSATFIFVR